MVNKELDNYEPFGDEWKKEVSKLPKTMLIEQWKKSRLEVKELGREVERLKGLAIETFDDYNIQKYARLEIHLNREQRDEAINKFKTENYL